MASVLLLLSSRSRTSDEPNLQAYSFKAISETSGASLDRRRLSSVDSSVELDSVQSALLLSTDESSTMITGSAETPRQSASMVVKCPSPIVAGNALIEPVGFGGLGVGLGVGVTGVAVGVTGVAVGVALTVIVALPNSLTESPVVSSLIVAVPALQPPTFHVFDPDELVDDPPVPQLVLTTPEPSESRPWFPA